jgi:GNAT superfamily N-acetyltransferase
MFRDVSEYSRWLQEGRRLLVAETEGRIVAYLFLQFNGTCVTEQVPERPLVMAKDACYTDEAWTVEDFRNRGIQRLLFLFKSRAAREEGKRWLITYYLHPSVVADAARNFARVGVDPPQKLCTVGYAHCAGFRFTWMHPETPLPERSALVFDHEP